jgi:hypothetical protein
MYVELLTGSLMLVWFEFNRFSVVKIQLKVSSSLRRVEDVAFCTIVKNTQSKSQAKSHSI